MKAVDGVSFDLHRGETLGLVGESGCGKSTLGRLLMGLEEPTGGQADFDGVDVYSQQGAAMRRLRRDIQIVFQDPYRSLNPRKTVGEIIGEPFEIHRRRARGRPPPAGAGAARPGRPQPRTHRPLPARVLRRAAAAHRHRPRHRAHPKVIICDEPVSALDVSVQAQVVNLLQELQAELGLAYMFIAHDLSVVRHIADRVAVMYLGKIVEMATRTRSTPARPTRTPRRCCPRCRCPIRPCAASETDRARAATCRARPTRRGLSVPHPVLEGARHLLGRRPGPGSRGQMAFSTHESACHFAEPKAGS